MTQIAYIEDIGKHVGEPVRLRGWLHNRRSSGLDLTVQIQSTVHALATARVWHPPTVDTKCFFTAGAAKSPDSIKRVAESD